ncbi:MAG: hypothetical protein CVU29_03795 [Betaproteobacteria bacterium HGW-Betaproteobacteria-22]|nr:MAG: hypothetical protein CVU29_03795 [Betaproteobacteria bacterium HGW-Betaproteobacteria-22]
MIQLIRPNPLPNDYEPNPLLSVSTFRLFTRPAKKADTDGLYLEIVPNGSKYWRFKYRFEINKLNINMLWAR